MLWTKDSIKTLLDTNAKAVTRGILAIYERQTADEQRADRTSHSNGIGYSAFDAEFMSSLARQIGQGRTLSVKQMAIGRNKIKRYAGQLAEIANAASEVRELQMESAAPGDCSCENYDGETLCPSCAKDPAKIQAFRDSKVRAYLKNSRGL